MLVLESQVIICPPSAVNQASPECKLLMMAVSAAASGLPESRHCRVKHCGVKGTASQWLQSEQFPKFLISPMNFRFLVRSDVPVSDLPVEILTVSNSR